MKKESIPYRIVYGFAKIVYYFAYNIKIEGKENLPDGAYIIAANHRSNADPPIIAITAGFGKFGFMAKEELFKNKLFGWLISKLGAFPVVRGKGDNGAIDSALKVLEEGRRLVIFPEGTRSKTGKVGKGKTGAAIIAAKSGYPVVPAGIVFGQKLHFRSKIIVRYGKLIFPDEISVSSNPTPHELKNMKSKIMDSITMLVEGEENV